MIRWELIAAYGLPTLFMVWAYLNSSMWASIALVAWTFLSLWSSPVWLVIAYFRWTTNKKELLWFVPVLLLALWSVLVIWL